MREDVKHVIVQWLTDEMKRAGARGFVCGLSGGLDSSVCAALIKQATDNCLGLVLPIESSVEDCDDAAAFATQLSLKIEYIDLNTLYNTFTRLLPSGNHRALGNIKARLRMIVLYYYANMNNYLVCGTGNKTEIMLGYFTKFGDGASDVLPIGDLYKYEVQQLARTLSVPEKIIVKVPSAGLWQNQTDEGEIGFCYEDIDQALQDIMRGTVSGECAQTLKRMIEQSEHKRQLPRICKIGNR
jgi:NAD+ synthase